MRNVIDKSCRENQNTHFMSNNFFSENRAVYDNVKKCGGARGATNDVTIWRTRVACWIRKATCTHAHVHAQRPGTNMHARTHSQKCVILIAFPRQK